MGERLEPFNQTTDLYLEMLREAQKVEDKKLILMIRRRLRNLRRSPAITGTGCEIIFFPRSVPPLASPVEDHPFWPSPCYVHILIFAALYLLLIIGHPFLG